LKSILVLCEGNHCRSPIAEALLRASLGPDVCVASAGLNALVDCPPDPTAQRVMAERGFDISNHRGRQVTPAMALAADLILVMEPYQKEACETLAPSTRGRVFLLGHWLTPSPTEIADPFRHDPEAFQHAFDVINQSVAAWLPRLNPKQRSA
jgi:protein-tyrosine phosphatase